MEEVQAAKDEIEIGKARIEQVRKELAIHQAKRKDEKGKKKELNQTIRSLKSEISQLHAEAKKAEESSKERLTTYLKN